MLNGHDDVGRARSALHAIDAGCDRDTWVKVLMASKAAGLVFDDIDAWSANGGNYKSATDCQSVWRSIDANGPVKAGTLFAMARESGWQDGDARANGHTRPPDRAQEPRRASANAGGSPVDCAAVWRDAEPAAADHPYIARKLGLPAGLRVYRGSLRMAGQSIDAALLVPAFDAAGELMTWQAIPAHAGAKKLNCPGRPVAGWFVVGGPLKAGETAYLCEGIGAAWSAHQATRSPAVVAFGAGRLKAVAGELLKHYPGVRLTLAGDVGKEGLCERIATELRCAWIAPPADLGNNSDLNDLHQRSGLQAVADLLSQAAEPVDERAPPANVLREMAAPPFEYDEVPGGIARMARAFSESTGFDRSGVLMAAVVAAASVIDDRFRLVVRPSSDWFESARLWAVLIGMPSAGKSPTIRAATDPIKDLHREAFAKWTADSEGVKEEERTPMPAIYTSDATTEALADRLRGNPRGMLMLTEEFSSWIGSIDAYRDGAGSRNRGEWLQLYDGGPHQVDRVKRGSFLVPNWSCSVLAACTPAGLREQMKRMPDDGLIHRFMPVMMRAPADRSEASARDALMQWSNLLRDTFSATTLDAPHQRLRLSVGARMAFDSEADLIRRSVDAVYETSPALASHLGKHPGMLARLSLVFHVIDRRQGDVIEGDTVEQAARFMRKVRKHAAVMFMGLLSSAPAFDLARALARSIVGDVGRPTSIGRDWMQQHCRAFRGASDPDRRLAVMALEDAGWLAPEPDSRAYGGWSASEWHIDARVFDLFAEDGLAHRNRRAAVRSLLEATA
mgnify:CR=1 FL=1